MPALLALLLAQTVTIPPYHHVPEPPPLPGTEWAVGRPFAELRARFPAAWKVTEGIGWIDVDLPACRLTFVVHGTDRGPVVDGMLPVTGDDRFLSQEQRRTCISAFAALR